MQITSLQFQGSLKDWGELQAFPLENLDCPSPDQRQAEGLRKHPTLKMIGGRPATQYWKDFDARKKDGK